MSVYFKRKNAYNPFYLINVDGLTGFNFFRGAIKKTSQKADHSWTARSEPNLILNTQIYLTALRVHTDTCK